MIVISTSLTNRQIIVETHGRTERIREEQRRQYNQQRRGKERGRGSIIQKEITNTVWHEDENGSEKEKEKEE